MHSDIDGTWCEDHVGRLHSQLGESYTAREQEEQDKPTEEKAQPHWHTHVQLPVGGRNIKTEM